VATVHLWFAVHWQLAIDWKVKGSLMMLIHHIIFPVSYGTGLYVIQPAYGMYVMAVLQVCRALSCFRYSVAFVFHRFSCVLLCRAAL
jgi:hypothetical protein